MACMNSSGYNETSQQGNLQRLKNDIQGHIRDTNDRICRLQETMEMLLADMERYLSTKSPQWNDFLKEEEVVSNDYQVSPRQRGIFRNPEHAVYERQKGQYRPTGRHEDNSKRNEFELTDSKSDNRSSKHLKLNFPVFEEGSDTVKSLQDCELDVEPLYDVEPIYDEEQGKGQECWPEQEFILAALNGGNLDAPNPLQTGICRSERSKELAEFSSIQDLKQKNVSPGDTNIMAYNAMQPNREEKYLEMSAVDPYIFHSLGISTANCLTDLGNSLTRSTGDKDMPSVGNNSIGEFVFNGLFPLFDEKGIYNDLIKPPEPSMPTNEAVHDLKKLVLMAENAIFLELNDPSRPLSCPFEVGQIEWIQGEEQHLADEEISSMILANMREMTETFLYKTITENPLTATISCKFGKISSNFGKENVLIFDPGGHVQNKQSKGVKNKVKDMFRSEVKLKEAVMKISVGG